MIRMGTSGFSYKDWIGEVYPADLPQTQWLSYYAVAFDTVELNVTYYRLPERKTVAGWVVRTPDDFLFSVKAHQSLTHVRVDPDFTAFRDCIAPLVEAGKLACVLAQFPYSFRPIPENRSYLDRLRKGLDGLPVVVEFRHADWIRDATFEQLESLGLGFCCVDEPALQGLMPPTARYTSSPAYVRFHGRNAERWWNHEAAWQRYDYTYVKEELETWLPKLSALDHQSPLTLVYANNHYRGQSVDTLKKLKDILAQKG